MISVDDDFSTTTTTTTTTSISFKCGKISNIVFWIISFIGLYVDHLASKATTTTKANANAASATASGGGGGSHEATSSKVVQKHHQPQCQNRTRQQQQQENFHFFWRRLSIQLHHHKIQPTKFLSRNEILDLICLSFINMVVIALGICCPIFEWMWNIITQHIHHHQYQSSSNNGRLLESDDWIIQYEILYKIPIQLIITEILFYCIHYYLLHHHSSSNNFLYNHIHKVHHRFIAPTSMCCVYAHPIEFVFGNILPIYLGPMITNAHPYTCYYIWFPLSMIGTCIGHCGYKLPLLPTCVFALFGYDYEYYYIDPHDDHHLYFKYNYGGMHVLDYILGTTTKSKSSTTTKTKT